MMLGTHETVVRSSYGILEPRTSDGGRRRPGVLYLTTERLVFEAPGSRGRGRDPVGGRDVEILLDARLVRLRDVSLRQGRWVRVRLLVDGADRRAVLDLLEPEAWTVAISDARRRAELTGEGGHGATGRVERTVAKRRCRCCRGLVDEGNDRCPSCGAPL
jgi:hypothetical protein